LAPPNSLSLGFAAFALVACQSVPETSPVVQPQPAPAAVAAPAASNSAVLDQTVSVAPPGKGVPARYAAFSGVWAGQLNGMYDGKLAVLTVLGPDAEALLGIDVPDYGLSPLDGGGILLKLPGGEGWRFRAGGGVLSVEESVYLGGPVVRRTEQLVVSGTMKDSPAEIAWVFEQIVA